MKRPDAPLCLRCKHYFITFDARFPYGCRAMGFKSQQLPCKEVEAASGLACQSFERRPASAGSSN
ncbi:MAG: hypothetical protein N3C63_08290 [Rhodocyclaceae bacterium]|nr:hypothetical protein [Rhodocyclaceae bacterium]